MLTAFPIMTALNEVRPIFNLALGPIELWKDSGRNANCTQSLKREQCAVFERGRMEGSVHRHIQHHGMMVAGTLVQYLGG